MQKLIVRQISGKRINQTDEFPVGSFTELVAGRDESAAIRFDVMADDMVSRRHMRIVPDNQQPNSFQIADLESRNGTFLNRQRLYAPARAGHGDVVQLGPGGPEFRLELDPAPASMARPTREAGVYASGASTAMPTREVSLEPRSEPRAGGIPDTPRPVGRATVERMLGESFNRVKGTSKKAMIGSLAASLVLLLTGAAFYMQLRGKAQENQYMAQEQSVMLRQMDAQVQQQPTAIDRQIGKLGAQLKQDTDAIHQRDLRLSELLAQQQRGVGGGPSARSAAAAPQRPPAPVVRQDPARPDSAAQGNPYTQSVAVLQNQWSSGQRDQAMQGLQQLISTSPQHWEGFLLAGNFDRQTGKYADALLAYRQAEALAPEEVKRKIQLAINQLSTQMASASPVQ